MVIIFLWVTPVDRHHPAYNVSQWGNPKNSGYKADLRVSDRGFQPVFLSWICPSGRWGGCPWDLRSHFPAPLIGGFLSIRIELASNFL